MSGFHVERHLSDACCHNYKQTPLSSIKTNIHINLEVQKSTPQIQAVLHGGSSPRHHARRMRGELCQVFGPSAPEALQPG